MDEEAHMQAFRRFRTDQAGSTGLLFGLSMIPLLGMVGSAFDYSRAAGMNSQMQRAVDATALAIVREPATATDKDIQAQGERFISNTIRSDKTFTMGTVSVTRAGNTVTVAAGGSVKSVVMQVLGFNVMPVAAQAKATWGTGTGKGAARIELALVLDNTGSMADLIGGRRKMDELQSSAKDLLRNLRALATDPDTVKVSVVPFDTEVRLDASANRNQPWFNWASPSDKAAWTGYVFDRYGSYATSDAAPTGGDSLYPAPRDTEYRTNPAMGQISKADLAPMRPLTSLNDYAGYSSLVSVVDGMRPRGYTNIALGVAWGMATLSKSEPFTEGAAPGTKGVRKVMVVLTDGDNTANHVDGDLYNADCSSCSSAKAKRLSDKQIVAGIDQRTNAACAMVKGSDVEVFTIRLLSGNESLLQGCATDANHYFNVQNAGELTNAFNAILSAISGTRLTM